MANELESPIDHWRRFRLLRYLVVGGANTAFAYLVYALGLVLGLPVPIASLISLLVSIVISFVSHGSLVFGHLSLPAFVRYVLNWSLMYLIYVGVVLGFMKFDVNPYLGGLVGMVVTTSLSFFLLGRVVFRTPVPSDATGAPGGPDVAAGHGHSQVATGNADRIAAPVGMSPHTGGDRS